MTTKKRTPRKKASPRSEINSVVHPPEKLDTTPIAIPEGAIRPPSIHDEIRRFMRHEQNRIQDAGFETEEEANDFEPEDPDILDLTRYELEPLEHDITSELDADAREEQPQVEPSSDSIPASDSEEVTPPPEQAPQDDT